MNYEGKKRLVLYKIMDSKDQINLSKEAALKSIELKHLKNKIKDTLKPLNKKIQTYNKKIDSQLKTVLNTSDIIFRAKKESFLLKDILLELDRDHEYNVAKFKKIREKSDDLKNAYLNIKHMEKVENEERNNEHAKENNAEINNNDIKPKKENEKFELSREKIHNLLNDNILLMAKKREIFSYYLIKNKYQKYKDERKIRYINKIKELNDLKEIELNDLLDEKEKKAKIENNKFFINQKKRIILEKRENYEKIRDKLNKENDLSLKSIKETNATLNTLRNNKSFLDEEIKLKYEHNHSQPSLKRNSFIDKINKEKRLIRKISTKYSNRLNKSELNHTEKRISKINNKRLISSIKSLQMQKYLEKLESSSKENGDKYSNESNESIVNLKQYRSSSMYIPKLILRNSFRKSVKLNSEILLNNNNKNNNSIYDDEDLVKSKFASVYEEIKNDNMMKKKDEDFFKNYFIRRKAILNKKPRQAITIMTNSLSRINHVDITKKIKKIHGTYIPEKYTQFFENLEKIGNSANKVKCTIYDRLCKSRMDS